jgi:drug/metabolite transporter (DMT)-like permease
MGGRVQAVECGRPAEYSRQSVRGLVEVVAAMTLAGSSVVVAKLLASRVPVFLSAELSLIAALVVIAPAQIVRRRELALLSLRERGDMFLQALFGLVLVRVCALSGLRLTGAAEAGLITSAAPAVMAVLAALMLRERIGGRGLAAIALAVAGLLAISLWGAPVSDRRGVLTGNLLVFGATVCEAFLTIFRKSSGGRIGSITNTAVLAAMSAAMLLPLALLELRRFGLSGIGAVGWLSVGYYGAVATVVAYILWGHGALRIPATMTGLATAAMPVSALALSTLVLGERLAPAHLVGCAGIVAGIVVGQKPVWRRRRA